MATGQNCSKLRASTHSPCAKALFVCLLVIVGCRPLQQQSTNGGSAIGQGAEDGKLQSDRLAATRGAEIESKPLSPRQSADGGPLFQLMDNQETGLNFVQKWVRRPEQIFNNTTGCGVSMGDFDADGQIDVFMARSADGGRLYRNLGNFRFEDVTDKAGVGGANRWTTGSSFVDVNNDGRLDLFVCAYDCPNHLYINQGDGTFVERAREYGLDYSRSSAMMAFSDYDRDGDLDGYLLTNHMPPSVAVNYRHFYDQTGRPHVPEALREFQDLIPMPDGTFALIEVGQYDHLYRNNGDGTFTDVSKVAGIVGNEKGLSVTWWDYDADGWPDIYVANDFFGADHLYRNNRDGTFTDVAADVLPHTPWFSMGSDLGDINNDGLVDYMATDMSASTRHRAAMSMLEVERDGWYLEVSVPRQYMRNAVYLNTGVGRMAEVAYLTGLDSTDWTWTVRWVDLDQDGKLDSFITNGMVRDLDNRDLTAQVAKLGDLHSDAYSKFWNEQEPLRQRSFAFKNLGDLKFKDVGKSWGLDRLGVSFGAAFGDLDNDGDLDLVVNNFNEAASVYRNSGVSGGGIRVQLRGRQSNRYGIGSTVRIRTGDAWQTGYLTLSRGFMSQSEPSVHFGVGEAAEIDELLVEWPSGHRQSFEKLAVNRLYTITEPGGAAPKADPQTKQPAQFARTKTLGTVKHREKAYDDFAREPLLPWRLSQLGPGLAAGDVLGSGRDGLFLGGGKWDWGTLLVPDGQGQWSKGAGLFPPWSEDVQTEDMGLLFVDVDGDGDQDLFVASGGVECEAGDELLSDRLYLNDGQGQFVAAPKGRLPDLRDSDAGVAAADYDRDGDLDLAIGGRSIPGRYPEVPASRLLKNDGRGTFTDATGQDAPELAKSGLVTSVLWSDANGDGWVDLLVTHEWGPIKLYLNDKGKLRDATQSAGLAKRLGWWNGIAGRDLDGDTDIDYVVTNLGLNTSYRVSAERPARLYYGDFSGEGRPILVEAKYDENGRLVPSQNKPALERAIPSIEAEYPTYNAYASATLEQIVGAEALAKAYQLEANTAASVILRNDGQGRFTMEPLPTLAQISAGFGVVLSDFNGDGHSDAYLTHNWYGPRRELGRIDGGLSLLLTGNKEGQLAAVPPKESGLVVPGDAKSVVATDLNEDGWPDLVVGVNDAEMMAFENHPVSGRRMATVRLKGRAGNPTAVGARVTVKRSDGVSQTSEVQAGGGYLSQSSARQWFGLGESATIASIEVRWPDGQSSTHTPPPNQTVIDIDQPGGIARAR